MPAGGLEGGVGGVGGSSIVIGGGESFSSSPGIFTQRSPTGTRRPRLQVFRGDLCPFLLS